MPTPKLWLIRTHTVETEDGRFVRKGAIGAWRAKLSESHVRLIEEWTGPTLLRMGYEEGSSVEATVSVSA